MVAEAKRGKGLRASRTNLGSVRFAHDPDATTERLGKIVRAHSARYFLPPGVDSSTALCFSRPMLSTATFAPTNYPNMLSSVSGVVLSALVVIILVVLLITPITGAG